MNQKQMSISWELQHYRSTIVVPYYSRTVKVRWNYGPIGEMIDFEVICLYLI